MKVFKKLLKNFKHESNTEERKTVREAVRNTSEGIPKDENDAENSGSYIEFPKLHRAVVSEIENEVKKYITRCCINEQNVRRETALHLAVSQNNPSIVELLLNNGASAEICDKEGFTPFLRAVEIGNMDLVRIFWDRKLNKTQTDFNGNTALHLAVSFGFYRIVQFFVKNSALVDIPNENGDYPLHTATRNEYFSIAKILLENHASVDVEDKMKRTPLLEAVRMENFSLAELFLKYGANPNQCDQNGMSVKDYALLSKNSNIRTLKNFDHTAAVTNDVTQKFGDQDSQSLELCIMPPTLEAPRSWNFLYPDKRLMDIRKRFRRNVKSLPSDFSRLILPDELSHINQRKWHSSTHLTEGYLNSGKLALLSKDDESSQYDNCRKLLDELSLDKLRESSKTNLVEKKMSPHPELEPGLAVNKLSLLGDFSKRRKFCNNFVEDFSDDDSLIWKNSAYENNYADDLWCENHGSITIPGFHSSSSEEDSDYDSKRDLDNSISNQSNRVTRDDQDLQTETYILRGTLEKLKYDLANYRCLDDDRGTILAQTNTHLAQLDSKYEKAIHEIHLLRSSISDIQLEMDCLRKLYHQFYESNQEVTRGSVKRKLNTHANSSEISFEFENEGL